MSGAGMKPEMVMSDQACAAGGGPPPHMTPVVFALPPERQLSVQIGEVDRQLSTRSNALQANKCFPAEYCIHDNGLFAHIPVVYPPTVSLQRKVLNLCPHP